MISKKITFYCNISVEATETDYKIEAENIDIE